MSSVYLQVGNDMKSLMPVAMRSVLALSLSRSVDFLQHGAAQKCRYTREISDPAHRQEYLDYLAQIEACATCRVDIGKPLFFY